MIYRAREHVLAYRLAVFITKSLFVWTLDLVLPYHPQNYSQTPSTHKSLRSHDYVISFVITKSREAHTYGVE